LFGNGRVISLWEDKWLGTETLKEKFPRLYFISSCIKVKLRQASGWNNNLEW